VLEGDLGCPIGGVVVDDVDRGCGQHAPEIVDDLPDRGFLVEARDEDGDACRTPPGHALG
jgi:hypothetical protein